MATSNAEPIYLHNDWLSRVRLTGFDAAASASAPLTGKTVTASLTATVGGVAIDASLSAAMVEGAAGDYSVPFPAAALAAHLAAFVGTVVYERFLSSDGALDESRPLLVIDQRVGS